MQGLCYNDGASIAAFASTSGGTDMPEILVKEDLTPITKLFEIRAPDVARRARAGQFVIIRIHEKGERIPLTIADYDRERGTITLVVQEVGKTTMQLGTMEPGDCFATFVGPLGHPAEMKPYLRASSQSRD